APLGSLSSLPTPPVTSGLGGAVHLVEQGMGVGNQAEDLLLVDRLPLERRRRQQGPHRSGQRVTSARERFELARQYGVPGIVGRAAALHRSAGERERVHAELSEGRVQLLVDLP